MSADVIQFVPRLSFNEELLAKAAAEVQEIINSRRSKGYLDILREFDARKPINP